MHKEKEITVGKNKIIAKDLSPRQIDKLLAGDRVKEGDTVGLLLNSNLTTEAVSMSTGIEVDVLLDSYSFEELGQIWEAVEEVNPFLLERLDGFLQQRMERLAGKS